MDTEEVAMRKKGAVNKYPRDILRVGNVCILYNSIHNYSTTSLYFILSLIMSV